MATKEWWQKINQSERKKHAVKKKKECLFEKEYNNHGLMEFDKNE